MRALDHGVYAIAPAIITCGLIVIFASGHLFASDFQHNYWPAAQRVLQGTDVYAYPVLPKLPFTYPAVAALLIAPFGLIPSIVGGAMFTTFNLAALPLSLRLIGVRDWRVLGVSLLWLPVIAAWETANVTLPLALGLALMWRWRDRPAAIGTVAAILVSIKPITWPVLVWLMAAGRYRGLMWATGVGLALNMAAWSVLGFSEIVRFETLMRQDAEHYRLASFTIVSLLLKLRVASGFAYVLGLIPGLVASVACFRFGSQGRDRDAMVAAVIGILAFTPIVWLHYYALLIIPLGLTHPKLSPAWALPMMMWVCLPTDAPAIWQIVVALLAFSLVTFVCLRPARTSDDRTPSYRPLLSFPWIT